MKIIIFGGTTEGRLLSHLLAEKGAAVTVCVATEYGCEEQGESPGVTVLTGRKTVEEMSELLRGSDESVLAIAGQLGYDNASKFARAFRQVMGVSPSAYRKGLDSCAPGEEASIRAVIR